MIQSKADYEFYCEADRLALDIPERVKKSFFLDEKYLIWKFQKKLRRLEYHINCKGEREAYIKFLQWDFYRFGRKLGFSIPPNVFGPGLSIAHTGTLIVNGNVRVGKNCRIHNCVHLATQAGRSDACPTLGDNLFIGPGVVVFGDIKIANDIAIGANSLVNKSFLEEGISIAGNPAKKISQKGSHKCYGRATEAIRAKDFIQILDYSHNHLRIKNTSDETWTKETALLMGVVGDRHSPCYNESWLSSTRVCTFKEDIVRPGEIANFEFTLKTGTEQFQLLFDGVAWVPNTNFEIAS